jgi:hypothetical protein
MERRMSSIFGGGGGNNNQAALMQNALLIQQMQQQQAALQNSQGQQLALLSKSQAKADDETASMNKPGLGRALLSYNPRDRSQTLGG